MIKQKDTINLPVDSITIYEDGRPMSGCHLTEAFNQDQNCGRLLVLDP